MWTTLHSCGQRLSRFAHGWKGCGVALVPTWHRLGQMMSKPQNERFSQQSHPLFIMFNIGLFKGSTRLRQCFKCHWISESLFSTSFQRQCLHLACCHSLCNLRSPYAFNILYLYNIKCMPACIFLFVCFLFEGRLAERSDGCESSPCQGEVRTLNTRSKI